MVVFKGSLSCTGVLFGIRCLVLMKGQFVRFTCLKCDNLIQDNSRIRLPKYIWCVCNIYSSEFSTEPFIYANPLACLHAQLEDQVLSLSVPSSTIGKPEIKVSNSNHLISIRSDTVDLEA